MQTVDNIRHNTKVAVLLGGVSEERDISLKSGSFCSSCLKKAGYQVRDFDTASDNFIAGLLEWRPDVCFNALHGYKGEDGHIQGLLEYLQIPYTHSGLYSSSFAMDKYITRLVYQDLGIPIAPAIVLSLNDVVADKGISPPYVVKPRCSGSSIGLHFVLDNDEVEEGRTLSERFPELHTKLLCGQQICEQSLLIEKYIAGRELSVGVVNGNALTVTEIIFNGPIFDFDAKYCDGNVYHVVDCDIPDDIAGMCKHFAELAHKRLGCADVSRTDFRLQRTESGNYSVSDIFALETNTHPGMTKMSLIPEQIEYCYPSSDIVDFIVSMIEGAKCGR